MTPLYHKKYSRENSVNFWVIFFEKWSRVKTSILLHRKLNFTTLRGGTNFTTKSIRRRIYSCDRLCRKLKFYHIFEQWIFGPNSLKLVITCQNSNFTTSKTQFYHIMSHWLTLIRKNVVKFSFRCGKIWVLTCDHLFQRIWTENSWLEYVGKLKFSA